jgi:Tol biopolymer transport system component
MISGRLPFKGDYEQAVIYSILNEEPEPLTALRSGLPIALDGIITKALSKDPVTRYQHVDELPADLKAIDLKLSQSSRVMRTATLPLSDVSRARASFFSSGVSWRLVLSLVALVALAAFTCTWFLKPKSTVIPQTVQRFILPSSQGEPYERDFAISPDGKHLAYIANDGENRRIFHRRMDEFQAESLPGTEDAHRVFFSPDGRWIGFVAQHKLKKISTTGGSPQIICDIFDWHFRGASWIFDDTIIFGIENSGLAQVSPSGGSPQMITEVDKKKGIRGHLDPQILPGGKHVLFAIGEVAATGRKNRESQIALLSLETKKWRVLLDEGGSNPQYVPTGHIVYHRSGLLTAVPFNLSKLKITGSSIPVLEGISKAVVVDDGSLFYVPSTSGNKKKLVWVDRNGLASPLMEQAGNNYLWPRLSPDGKRVAFGEGQVIWIYDIERGSRTRFTIEGNNGEPIWTSDGKWITFWAITKEESSELFWKAADGSGQAEPLTGDEVIQGYPGSWSPDGQALAFYGSKPGGQSDIWLLPLGGNPRAIIATQFIERLPMISPDGRWLAYVSNESGRKEVYVQPYPAFDKRWLISNDGGNEPTWAGDGKELFYRNGHRMMAVSIQVEPEFRAGKPRVLFEAEYDLHRFDDRNYDITRDAQRFVMVQSEKTSEIARIHVVVNWFEELQRKMQEKQR